MTTPHSNLPPLKVLAADSLAEGTTLQRVFGDRLTLIFAYTMHDAMAALDQDLDAIICNIHFDKYRMSDLLRMAKAHSMTRGVPFICFRELDSDLGASVTNGLVTATKSLGAAAFLDMYTLKRVNGAAGADIHLRDLVMELARSGRAKRRRCDA